MLITYRAPFGEREVSRRVAGEFRPRSVFHRADGEGGGGAGDGGGEGGSNGGGSGEGGEGEGEGSGESGGSGDGEGEGEGSSSGEGDDGGDELAKARKAAASADRARRDAERKLKEREDADAEAKGEHKRLAEQRAERIGELEGELDKVRGELADVKASHLIERVANRLNFRDPADVEGKLSDDDKASEQSVEKALKKLAGEKPYLVGESGTGQRADVNGDSNDSGDVEPGLDRMRRAYASSSG